MNRALQCKHLPVIGFPFMLELDAYAEEPDSYSGSLSQFSSRGDQIPGIGDNEMPVVPAKTEDDTVTGRYIAVVTCTTQSTVLSVNP